MTHYNQVQFQQVPCPEAAESEAERGSVLPLIVGLCLVLLLVASTVVGVSSVYLERQRLQALADQAATSAAQHIEGITAVGEAQAQATLTSAGVQASAHTFLQESGAGADGGHVLGPPGDVPPHLKPRNRGVGEQHRGNHSLS